MGAFSFFDSHTKIRKNTHIYDFIKLTNMLIINNIVKLCNKYLSPKLMQNQKNSKLLLVALGRFLLFQAETHHCEIVVRLSPVAVLTDGIGQRLDNLLSRGGLGLLQQFENLFIAELLLQAVLGLVEPVGVYEQQTIFEVIDGLTRELQSWP